MPSEPPPAEPTFGVHENETSHIGVLAIKVEAEDTSSVADTPRSEKLGESALDQFRPYEEVASPEVLGLTSVTEQEQVDLQWTPDKFRFTYNSRVHKGHEFTFVRTSSSNATSFYRCSACEQGGDVGRGVNLDLVFNHMNPEAKDLRPREASYLKRRQGFGTVKYDKGLGEIRAHDLEMPSGQPHLCLRGSQAEPTARRSPSTSTTPSSVTQLVNCSAIEATIRRLTNSRQHLSTPAEFRTTTQKSQSKWPPGTPIGVRGTLPSFKKGRKSVSSGPKNNSAAAGHHAQELGFEPVEPEHELAAAPEAPRRNQDVPTTPTICSMSTSVSPFNVPADAAEPLLVDNMASDAVLPTIPENVVASNAALGRPPNAFAPAERDRANPKSVTYWSSFFDRMFVFDEMLELHVGQKVKRRYTCRECMELMKLPKFAENMVNTFTTVDGWFVDCEPDLVRGKPHLCETVRSTHAESCRPSLAGEGSLRNASPTPKKTRQGNLC